MDKLIKYRGIIQEILQDYSDKSSDKMVEARGYLEKLIAQTL
jgi:hypothetical protein